MPASKTRRRCIGTGTTSRTNTRRSSSSLGLKRAKSRPSRSSNMSQRKLAIVTGASSGIGLEIAKLAAQDGYDLVVAADTPFVEAGPALQEYDVEVEQVEADLATKQGVDQLLQLVG